MNGYSKIDTITTDADHKEIKELDEKGERFGVILGKSSSVSSSSSSAYGFHARMKRAISMGRCSSVTERYGRIHDQNMAIASSDHDTETRSVNNKKHKGGNNILKACKRLLGF